VVFIGHSEEDIKKEINVAHNYISLICDPADPSILRVTFSRKYICARSSLFPDGDEVLDWYPNYGNSWMQKSFNRTFDRERGVCQFEIKLPRKPVTGTTGEAYESNNQKWCFVLIDGQLQIFIPIANMRL